MNATLAAASTRTRGRLGGRRPPLATLLALVIITLITFGALFAPILAPFDPAAQQLQERLLPPGGAGESGTHWLGTDTLGRDLFSRLLHGARISLVISALATIGQTVAGTALGLIAGYRRGVWDIVIMRVVDIQLTIPFLALAIAVAAVLGSSLENVTLVLIITNWVFFTRVVRGDVLSTRERVYIEAARAIGARDRTILLRHILPNVSNSILVLASFQVARTILAEATLSFLGLGVQPPTPTWGGIITDGRSHISSAWWISTIPGVLITLFVLATNLLGNWLRDLLDPRWQRQV